jgi:hypothetical protein
MSSTDWWRRGARRSRREQSDTLRDRDGVRIPVWSAEAADPVDHLAAVLDQLKDTRRASSRS